MTEGNANAPAGESGELAFAAKLTVTTSADMGEAASQAANLPSGVAATQPLQKSVATAGVASEADAAGEKNAAVVEMMKPSTAYLQGSFAQENFAAHAGAGSRTESAMPSVGTAVNATPANSTPAGARLAESMELPAAPPASPGDITVRIPDSERGTDVRFVERGGEVHVSVRTSDSEMAQTLRSGLTDFSARLEQGGIKAELWRPGSGGSDGSSSQNQSERRPGDQRGSQRGQPGDSGNGNQDSKKPEWVEALEMSIGRQA